MSNKQPRTVYRRHGDYLDVSGPINVGLRQYLLGIQEALWVCDNTGVLSHGWHDVWENLSHASVKELIYDLKGVSFILDTMSDVQGNALREFYQPLFYYEKDDPNPLSLKTIRLLISGHLSQVPDSFIINVTGDHEHIPDIEWAAFAESVGYNDLSIKKIIRHEKTWPIPSNKIPVTFYCHT